MDWITWLDYCLFVERTNDFPCSSFLTTAVLLPFTTPVKHLTVCQYCLSLVDSGLKQILLVEIVL